MQQSRKIGKNHVSQVFCFCFGEMISEMVSFTLICYSLTLKKEKLPIGQTK